MQDILNNGDFHKEIESIIQASGQSADTVWAEARSNLAEIHGQRSAFAIRIFARLSRYICRRGYDSEYIFDTQEVDKIRKLSKQKSVVYLVSHKTYLDFFVLYDFLYRNDITPPYIFGGINMAFWGFARLARWAGAIFIRRTFSDKPIYKAVLNRYIQSLINEGCSFSWAIEGTRSRTGKLLHPKIGLLKYVTSAAKPLGEDAIAYIPISVSYDQIPDVASMTAQDAGATKKPESLSWFIKYIRQIGKNNGKIYLRFGEPITMSQTPEAPDLISTQQYTATEIIGVQKLAFEVCYHINEITPATTISLVLLSVLCHTRTTKKRIHQDVKALQLYLTESQSLSIIKHPNRPIPNDVETAISVLINNGIVQSIDRERDLCITPKRFLMALYYSNMAVHHFISAAFAELCLLNASDINHSSSEASFINQGLDLRDLFKFEFFFSRKDQFSQKLIDELHYMTNSNLEDNTSTQYDTKSVLCQQPLLIAFGALFPFINAYQIVADQLLQTKSNSVVNSKEFIERCLQSQLTTDQNSTKFRERSFATKTLLSNGYLLAENRKLLIASDSIDKKRQQFANELKQFSEQLIKIRTLTG